MELADKNFNSLQGSEGIFEKNNPEIYDTKGTNNPVTNACDNNHTMRYHKDLPVRN